VPYAPTPEGPAPGAPDRVFATSPGGAPRRRGCPADGPDRGDGPVVGFATRVGCV